MIKSNEKYEIPVILYEEPQPGLKPNPIPYIEVPENKTMPPVIWIFEYKETGETDIGDDGNPAKVVDQIPHQYCDITFLKERLPGHVYDMVRTNLGMKPLKEAQTAGKEILNKVQAGMEKSKASKAKKDN